MSTIIIAAIPLRDHTHLCRSDISPLSLPSYRHPSLPRLTLPWTSSTSRPDQGSSRPRGKPEGQPGRSSLPMPTLARAYHIRLP
ncbi:hypothetical protein LX36DRAFT_329884 [Colletotrichum falcatum]|nr:hypothetical protein LX36DRAFT_329884 [Colletotrichum falcatum]